MHSLSNTILGDYPVLGSPDRKRTIWTDCDPSVDLQNGPGH